MTKLILVLLLFSTTTFANSVGNLKRIAFGSCNNQNDAQPLWADVVKQKPDLWIWGGDAVYGDWKSSEVLAKAFNDQNANPDYQKNEIPDSHHWHLG